MSIPWLLSVMILKLSKYFKIEDKFWSEKLNFYRGWNFEGMVVPQTGFQEAFNLISQILNLVFEILKKKRHLKVAYKFYKHQF